MKALLLLALSLTSVSCVVPTGAGGVIGAPASSGKVTAADAERIALRVAADHGYTEARAEKVHHDEGQGGRWKVAVRGLADGRDNKIDVRISDAGDVIDVKDHRKGGKKGKKD